MIQHQIIIAFEPDDFTGSFNDGHDCPIARALRRGGYSCRVGFYNIDLFNHTIGKMERWKITNVNGKETRVFIKSDADKMSKNNGKGTVTIVREEDTNK